MKNHIKRFVAGNSVSHDGVGHTTRTNPDRSTLRADCALGSLDRDVRKAKNVRPVGRMLGTSKAGAAAKGFKLKSVQIPRIGSTAFGMRSLKGTKGTKATLPSRMPLKVEQSVLLPNGAIIELSGMRAAASNEKYVAVRTDGDQVIMPYRFWHGSAGEASRALVRGGITVVRSMAPIADAASQLKRFPKIDVVIRPGWSTSSFALVSGRVFVGEGKPTPPLAFSPNREAVGSGGTLRGWKKQVALPLAQHDLASFYMMAAFAAPLLKQSAREDNFGFELSGPPGVGKTTLLMLMASSAGPAVGPDGMSYWASCNTTMNALEKTMEEHSDLPLILDEAGLVQGGARTASRANDLREMAFRLANGRVKHRYGEERGRAFRLVFFLSTNRPIASLLGAAHAAEADAIADRIITVPVVPEQRYGIFDFLPSAYTATGLFADALKRAASQHYGHALPAFIQFLVKRHTTGPKKLGRQIGRLVQRFIQVSGADANDGSKRRVAEAFGLVYAAGRLAKAAGVLPKGYRAMAATLACYRLHCEHGRMTHTFDNRLRILMADTATIDTSITKLAKLSEKDVSACHAFLYVGRSGSRELLIPVAHRTSVFADWNAIRADPDVTQRLSTSKRRDTVKRPVGPGGTKVAVYSFDISDLSN